ncbi:LysR family transcriptional regulator [Paratractidigestivibacter sp.]|uniref:LysR family transcriptional regulator n=1 Tax=Paratractidigestivibacter sp. TaxID=2847316 RepID=UPI002AC9ED72|nr:LysR family transcriptional regulator [Paratractidigestivibacter sp.]
MELRTLRYFLAVAREENMTEAANVLHVTQPTLSRQIADLERELGVTLFDRTNRACVLTGDGMLLRQRAEEIISLVDQTEAELADNEHELSGNIRIGGGETQAMRPIMDTFVELHRENPRVTIELYTGNADAVEERLERGLLDFALLIEPVNLEKYEWLQMPGADRVGVAVATTSEWGSREGVTPEDVARMPLLLSSRTTNKAVDLVGWSGGAIDPERLNVVGHHDLLGNAAHLVRTGEACAMGIDHLLQLESADLRFVPLDPPMNIKSFLVWKKYRLRSRACEELLRRLRV